MQLTAMQITKACEVAEKLFAQCQGAQVYHYGVCPCTLIERFGYHFTIRSLDGSITALIPVWSIFSKWQHRKREYNELIIGLLSPQNQKP